MSAVYGIIHKDGTPVDPSPLKKMHDALEHRCRGGSARLVCNNAGFGFCRLAVHAQQVNEQLPMETGSLLFTADAHLHNRETLLNKLGLNKSELADTPDSVLILKAYQKWGSECVHQFDGEYVYVIWDMQSRQLFVSKDHIGYKALYYYDTAEAFIFCSEIVGIEAVKNTADVFDDETLVQTFFFQGDQSATYNREIKSLRGGSVLQMRNGEIAVSKYWQLAPFGKYSFTKDTEWYECFRDLLVKAVTARLNTDVPVGIRLSGGLDSSGIACILSKVLMEKNKPLYSFSSVLPDDYIGKEKDERMYIEMVLSQCRNIIPTFITADNIGPYDDIDAVFQREEGIPYVLHFMDTAICRAAAEKQVSILYSGMGGDHGVSGHGSDVLYKLITGFRWNEAKGIIRELKKRDHHTLWSIFSAYILLRIPIYLWYRKYKAWDRQRVFHPGFRKKMMENNLENVSQLLYRVNNGTTGRMMQRLNNRHEHYGISTADPLVDRNILEFIADMPQILMFKGGFRRSHYRYAMDGILPPGIQWREDKNLYVANGADKMRISRQALSSMFSYDMAGRYFGKIIDKSQFYQMYGYLDRPLSSDKRKIPFLLGQVFIFRQVLEILEKKKYKLVTD